VIKIGDFGLTKHLNSIKEKDVIGESLAYMAPEQKKGEICPGSDVYALGLILFELLAQFSTTHERQTAMTNLKQAYVLPESFSKKYPIPETLILQMIAKNASDRPSVSELIQNEDLLLWEKKVVTSNKQF
jgi:serine/threonine protein kinase